jgi:cellulose biosynthesis protein BcsQ
VRNIDVMARREHVAASRYMLPGTQSDGDLWVLPGNRETHAIPYAVRDGQEAMLAEIIEDADDIDVCIIDSAPSAGTLLNFAWTAADAVVIPSKMEMLSIHGVAGTMLRAERTGVRVLGIVPNMVREQTRLHTDYLAGLKEQAKAAGVFVFEPIADRIVWAEASSVQHALTGLEGEVGKARAEGIRFVQELIVRMKG